MARRQHAVQIGAGNLAQLIPPVFPMSGSCLLKCRDVVVDSPVEECSILLVVTKVEVGMTSVVIVVVEVRDVVDVVLDKVVVVDVVVVTVVVVTVVVVVVVVVV